MGLKESNEITVKVKCELNELYRILEENGFKATHRFSMDDYYLIPESLNLNQMSVREILAKAVLVRDICGKTSGKTYKMITVKEKKFDENGNILSQKATKCDVYEVEDAKSVLKAMGYKEIMNIKEDDIVYEKDGFELAIKDVLNGDKLIEVETDNEYDTIDKLIKKINEINIPIYTDTYFVKKAEVELEKILTNI